MRKDAVAFSVKLRVGLVTLAVVLGSCVTGLVLIASAEMLGKQFAMLALQIGRLLSFSLTNSMPM
jgi:hypothetical protein